jgi:hypothetical protein
VKRAGSCGRVFGRRSRSFIRGPVAQRASYSRDGSARTGSTIESTPHCVAVVPSRGSARARARDLARLVKMNVGLRTRRESRCRSGAAQRSHLAVDVSELEQGHVDEQPPRFAPPLRARAAGLSCSRPRKTARHLPPLTCRNRRPASAAAIAQSSASGTSHFSHRGWSTWT